MAVDYSKRAIYHFTHIDNLERVLRRGQLLPDNAVQAGGGCLEVGDQGLKAKRRVHPVTKGRKGVLADYVPFYFAPRSPMLLRIATRWNVAYQGGEGPLVFLASSIRVASAAVTGCVFTDGHPIAAWTNQYDDPAQLDEIDWKIMAGTQWNDTPEDPDRQRRRQAEFLVPAGFSMDLVSQLGTRSADIAAKVEEIVSRMRPNMQVAVQPTWFYQK